MKSKTVLNLENLVLSKIAVKLWDIQCIPSSFEDKEWFDSEQIIMKTAEKFKLPKILIEKIKIFVRIVGLEIYRFFFNLDIIELEWGCAKRIASYLRWTAQSTVNLQETIYIASKDIEIPIFERYKLCCCFCLEKSIPELWNQLSESEQSFFLNPKDTNLSSANFWSFEITNTDYDYQAAIDKSGAECKTGLAIENSVNDLNKYATEYYLNILTPILKHYNILGSFYFIELAYEANDSLYPKLYSEPDWNFNDLILILFSEIKEEFMSKVIHSSGIKVHRILQSHLDWPHQEQFLTVMDYFKSYMKNEDYSVIIQVIMYKMKCNCKDYDYKFLLQSSLIRFAEFSNKSLSLIIAENFLHFLPSFDSESILLLLSCIMPGVKEEIIFHNSGQRLLRCLAIKDEDLLRLFIISCVPEKIVDKLKFIFTCDENSADSQVNLTIISILNDTFSKKLLQSDKLENFVDSFTELL